MELQPKRIGERIRFLRVRRNLTQKELAGEQMTRNMLSLIENGSALPSLNSLVYLAEILDVPVDYFFSATDEDEGRYLKLSAIHSLRQAYAAERYEDCITQIQALPVSAADDEISLIGANAYLYTALQSAAAYELKTAQQHLKTSQDFLQKTVYAGEDLKKALVFYRELFTLLPSSLEFPERLTDLRFASSYIPAEMLVYLSGLRGITRGMMTGKEFPKESYASKHIQALQAVSANRTDTAVRLLRELAQDGELPYYMRFRVYSDLEEAAGLTREYRVAYMAARKKLDLLENAKK
ncbi:MAG: helix-turn-helix transcriptional regulator [Clostridia bacterium]|nr:helix-turn-helix transcriptional regulator [Clostridia bacterium]